MGWLQLNPTGILAQLFAEPPHPPPVRSDPFAELGSDISDPRNMYEYYQRQLAVSRERLDAYRDYEDMDYDDLITSVLDALAEDCTQQDFISQRVVWIESENADVKDLMTELLDNLKIEERAPKIIRETAKYGDAFYDMVQMPGEGVLALDYMDPKVVWRHEVQGILKGWQLTKDLTPRDDEVLPPWLICHFMRTTGREQVGATYGDSFIRPARRLYRKYQMVEDAMILYRLRRAPDRDVYYVDVGTAPSQEAPQIVRLWRSMLKKTMWYSPQQPGKMRSELNPLSYDEDLFWPIRENSNSRVERLTGSTNTDQIYDVEMLMNRLFSTIRAPKEYFGFGDDRSLIDTGKSLAQQDIRWARGCKSLQHSLTRGIMNIGAVHMALLGINPQVPENEFQVHMTPVSNLDEQQRAEIYDARTQVMDSLNRLVSEIDNIDKKAWLSWMMTKFGGLPPHLLDQFIQDAEKEGAAMDGLQGESLTESDKVVLTRHLGDLTGDFSNIVGVSTSSATLNGNLLPELVTS